MKLGPWDFERQSEFPTNGYIKHFLKIKVIQLAWEIWIQTWNRDFSLLKIFLNIFSNIYEIIMSTNITNFVFNLK